MAKKKQSEIKKEEKIELNSIEFQRLEKMSPNDFGQILKGVDYHKLSDIERDKLKKIAKNKLKFLQAKLDQLNREVIRQSRIFNVLHIMMLIFAIVLFIWNRTYFGAGLIGWTAALWVSSLLWRIFIK